MTNYEWLIKNKPELVKNVLGVCIGKHNGIPECCSSISCCDCDFYNDLVWCRDNAKNWLEQEHKPLYKKGDIVIDSYNQVVLVVEDGYDEDIMVSRYIEDYKRNQHTISITDIKKKVGHLEETDDPSLCASCKSEKCILPTGVAKEHCDFYKAE